ncbi:MAG: AMP-binding protein [Gemmatimonadota bacterium]
MQASEALSVFAAARQAPGAIALCVDGRRFTFSELAELTRERLRSLELDQRAAGPYPLDAANALDTVVSLYALLERRIPALLLHPRLTAPERDAELRAAAGGRLDADAAAVIYTSGTTGYPRGAVLTRSALAASARASAANLGWHEDDCWLLCMSIARVGGLSIITRCLIARRPYALLSAFDAEHLPAVIEQHRTTLVSVVPTMLALLLDAHPDWMAPPYLRAILLGGAAASPRLLQRAAARRLPIVITYGLTEACSQVVATPYEMRYDTARCAAGRPLPEVGLRLVDGRIQVRGPMLMAGYLDEPALSPGAWFDTGDVGELDAEGFLHVHARAADLIVSGGENVYPAEVERVLEECPGVAAAAVFGIPDETWGQVVAAALVMAADAPTEAALRDYIDAHLAPHKRPRRFSVVRRLPQTPAGKLDRPALEQLLAPQARPFKLSTGA